jgi:hypothetical protein
MEVIGLQRLNGEGGESKVTNKDFLGFVVNNCNFWSSRSCIFL